LILIFLATSTPFGLSPLELWLWIAPPLAGGIIGYFTNDLAIRMLFRPYKALYVGSLKVPFTPGLIPSNQDRLAKRISDAIMGSLLTPDELEKLARKLLAIERVQQVILWLLQMSMEQVKTQDNQRTAKILARVLQDLFGGALPRLIRGLAKQDVFLQEQLDQVFDQVLLEFQLNGSQAQQMADWLLEGVFPADTLRQSLVDFLTDRNIEAIDTTMREKSLGTYWVIANLFGVRTSLEQLRQYCRDEKETTNRILAELIRVLFVRRRLQEWLQNFSLQNLPSVTLQELRQTMRETVRAYLRNEGTIVLKNLGKSFDWEKIAMIVLRQLRGSPVMTTSLELASQELALIVDSYLEKDLEVIVAKAIPILGIDEVIMSRVMATPPAQLEEAIQGIVKSELQAIVNLGGVLGFVIGGLQSLSLLLR
jgi:uncharacterized membrane protein YheB (UPF0754 family)